jgi:hypothetical protein
MTTNDKMAATGQTESPTEEDHEHSTNGLPEKGVTVHEETTHEAAERGHAATDQ